MPGALASAGAGGSANMAVNMSIPEPEVSQPSYGAGLGGMA